MATQYADRAFISVNGAVIADVQSASLKQNHNRRAVPNMTRNFRNKGFVQGNLDIDVSVQIAIQNTLARPKLENINYATADVQIGFEVGGSLYMVKGVYLKDNDDGAGGIGDEAKTNFNFGALDLVDPVGNSSLFDIEL